ncbi:MAG: glycosyltransferase [Patescibacteria group bacterium]
MKIVVISATYNEKGNIERLINIIETEVFPKIKNHETQLLIADDNSPDGTGDMVRKLMKKWKNLSIDSGERKGLGAAYLRAINFAIKKFNADVVFEIDADLSHDPREIPNFLKKMEEGYDIVTGTRYSQGGSMPKNWPIHRKTFSVIGNLLIKIITCRFYIYDWTGGFRAIKKEVFLKEKDKLSKFQGYTFQVAFLYKALLDGYKVGHVPIHFTDRTLGRSKIAPLEYIVSLLKYVISERIRELMLGKFGKFLTVGGVGFTLNAIVLRTLVETFRWHPASANLAGAVVAIFSNYNFNNIWTFSDRKSSSIFSYFKKLIGFYASSATGVIFIQTGTIFIGTNLFGKRYYFVYFLVGTFFLLIWNFTMYSKVIWRRKK